MKPEQRVVGLSFLLAAAMALPAQTTNTFPASGSVGIGTTNPGNKLHIVAGDETALKVDTTSAGDNPAIFLAQAGTNRWEIYGAGSELRFYDYVANAWAFGIYSGKFAVGTVTPSTTLHSAGIVSISQGPSSYLIDNTATMRLGRYDGGPGYRYGYLQAPYGEALHIWNHATYNVAEFRDNRDSVFHGKVGVGIGAATPSHELAVNGTVRAKEVIVDTGWADYVFADGYRLAPLSEVEAHIRDKRHLPGIPSATEVAKEGISLGEVQAKLLAKIEELTLHQIAQEKRLNAQAARIEALERENKILQTR